MYIDPDRIFHPRPDIPNTMLTPHPLRKDGRFQIGDTVQAKVDGPSYATGIGNHPAGATCEVLFVGHATYNVRCNWNNVQMTVPYRALDDNFKLLNHDVVVALCT